MISCDSTDGKMSQPLTFACGALLEGSGLRHILGLSPPHTWVLMTCEPNFQVTGGPQWFHGFISRVAALLHSSPLCFVRLWWAAPSAPPVTQFHFHSPLPDTFSITAWLPRHLCLPPANGISKRRCFALRMRSLSDKLCIWPTSASHPVRIHFAVRGTV